MRRVARTTVSALTLKVSAEERLLHPVPVALYLRFKTAGPVHSLYFWHHSRPQNSSVRREPADTHGRWQKAAHQRRGRACRSTVNACSGTESSRADPLFEGPLPSPRLFNCPSRASGSETTLLHRLQTPDAWAIFNSPSSAKGKKLLRATDTIPDISSKSRHIRIGTAHHCAATISGHWSRQSF